MKIRLSAQGISLKIIGDQISDADFNYSNNQKIIKIGRNNSDCEINLKDQIVSHYQCYIQYCKYWSIIDGFNEPSTSGTWLYAKKQTHITHETTFRAGKAIFRCEIIGRRCTFN